jgi:hypothetical protein
MGTLIVSGIFTFLQSLSNGVVWLLGNVMAGISDYALVAAKQPWVQIAEQVTAGIAMAIFSVYLGWTALSQYILWNEGNSDQDGSQLWKRCLRVAIYGSAGTWLAYNVFQLGIWWEGALVAAPMSNAVTTAGNVLQHLVQLPSLAIEDYMVLQIGVLVLVVCLVIVTLQMSIRTAELVFYVVAAPVVALGQLQPDGGVWNNWWRGLVVLSLSQAAQGLGIKGVIASMQVITTGGPAGVTLGLNLFDPMILISLGLVLSIGFAIVTIRGPHMLKEWSYHTGLSGAGSYGVQALGRGIIERRFFR